MSIESEFDEAADVIAQLLLERSLQCDPFPKPPDEMFHVRVNQLTRSRFEKKTRTYCIATILIALSKEEERNPRFALVRQRIERAAVSSESSARKEFAAAKTDLKTLLFHPRQDPDDSWKLPIPWARAWLEDVGIYDVNFIGASLFAHCWMQHFIGIARVLPELRWR